MRVCIGGTFDTLHKGHKKLIDTAFKIAGEKGTVFIGITKKNFSSIKGDIESYKNRKKNVKKYLQNKCYTSRAIIKPINDKYGPTLDEEFDSIVVTSETKKTAEEINNKRINKKLKPLKILTIPFVLADDNISISSTRIRNKKIDEEGRIITRD